MQSGFQSPEAVAFILQVVLLGCWQNFHHCLDKVYACIVYLTRFKSFNVIFELSLSLQFLSNINENDEDSEEIAESR